MFEARVLADGQVADTLTTVYTVPSGNRLYLNFVSVFNTGAAHQVVFIAYKNGTDPARRLRRYSLAQNESAEYVVAGKSVLLEAGDQLQLQATSAGAVDYLVTGVLQDVSI
jgi:hypothetical protein